MFRSRIGNNHLQDCWSLSENHYNWHFVIIVHVLIKPSLHCISWVLIVSILYLIRCSGIDWYCQGSWKAFEKVSNIGDQWNHAIADHWKLGWLIVTDISWKQVESKDCPESILFLIVWTDNLLHGWH